MSRSDRSLSSRQVKALGALLEGRTVEEAGCLAGVSKRQVYRYLRDKNFTSQLQQEQDALISAVGAKLVSLGQKALICLEAVMEHPGMGAANVKRLAAVSVLDLLLKYRSQVELEARVSILEEEVNKRKVR